MQLHRIEAVLCRQVTAAVTHICPLGGSCAQFPIILSQQESSARVLRWCLSADESGLCCGNLFVLLLNHTGSRTAAPPRRWVSPSRGVEFLSRTKHRNSRWAVGRKIGETLNKSCRWLKNRDAALSSERLQRFSQDQVRNFTSCCESSAQPSDKISADLESTA